MAEKNEHHSAVSDFLSSGQRQNYPLPLRKPNLNYQDLTNLSCCLDVIATILANHDVIGPKELFTALFEGARYNGASADDIFNEGNHHQGSITPNWQASGEDLLLCSESLINQLVLELEEQHVTKGQRI